MTCLASGGLVAGASQLCTIHVTVDSTIDSGVVLVNSASVASNGTIDPTSAEGEVEQAVADVNRDLSRFEQIKRYAILPRDFTAEAGEVTPTLKLKRRVCQEHFADEIEALYS